MHATKKEPIMEKSIVRVACDVSSCVHNVDGTRCNKSQIQIAEGDSSTNEHFCKSYEHCCGFGKSK